MSNYYQIKSIPCHENKKYDNELKNLIFEEIKYLDLYHFPTPWTKIQWKELFSENVSGHNEDYFYLLSFLMCEDLSDFSKNKNVKCFSLYSISKLDSSAHLLKTMTNPRFRGQGLAGTLLDMDIHKIKHLGCSRIILEVSTLNNAAINLYQKFNLKVIHKKNHFYGQNLHAYVMMLDF
jgi:ribosomal protein S18 acetylase RimI-like enzyme